jgi:ABC-type phosphate/phosphonate transport system substrate-binding protein
MTFIFQFNPAEHVAHALNSTTDFECFLSNSLGSEVVAFPTAPYLQFQKLLQTYQADFGFKKKYVLMETLESAAAKTDFLH